MDRRAIRLNYVTPLSSAFFSDFNKETIQRGIISAASAKTGVTISPQNDSDLQSFMRTVYTDLVRDPYTDVRQQIALMNTETIKRTMGPITTGVLQQAIYLRDISTQPVPMAAPSSTSTYGNKIPTNFKFGIF